MSNETEDLKKELLSYRDHCLNAELYPAADLMMKCLDALPTVEEYAKYKRFYADTMFIQHAISIDEYNAMLSSLPGDPG